MSDGGTGLASSPIAIPADTADYVHLRNGGTSVLLRFGSAGLPAVLHWGEDLGSVGQDELNSIDQAGQPPVPFSAPEAVTPLTLLPTEADGYTGSPGLIAEPDGRSWLPALATTGWDSGRDAAGVAWCSARSRDSLLDIEVTSELALDAHGVLRVRHAVLNRSAGPLRLHRLAAVLPVPDEAQEVLDLAGRWCRERVPQRQALRFGTWLRESRHGRPGHDSATAVVAGTPGFGNRSGRVWAVHSAWSGNSSYWLERSSRHPAVLGTAELLAPGEVQLGPGDRYEAPWALAVFSDRGLDGIADKLHAMLRATSDRARSPRPVSLNTWEAVYFRQSMDVLGSLADAAARVGVERFVVDDGWFRGRVDDSRGLGDWFVDETTWPEGLGPLVERVTRLGMRFGLWVEPEGVNPDSGLAREHPEWISTSRPGHLPPGWRHEQVLDLTNPGAFQYVLRRLDSLLTEYPITYLKWDYNRDHFDGGANGHPTVRAQTLALYRLLDEITTRHPGVEIESCASGGARVDLGIARWADRFWASDTIDPVERVDIQRWTNLLLPLERIGTHLGAATAHTTGRTASLSFRLAVATFGHFGIEADIGGLPEAELEEIRRYVGWYKTWRSLLHSGTSYNEDHPDTSQRVYGVVSQDRAAALVACVQLTATAFEIPHRLRLHVLDDDMSYRVRVADVPGPAPFGAAPPTWLRTGEVLLTGRSLRISGLQLPVLLPASALLLEVRASTASGSGAGHGPSLTA